MAENSILCLHGPMSTFNCLFNGPNPTSTQWQRTQFSAYMVPCQPSTASSMAQIQLQLNGRELNSLPTWSHVNLQLPLQWPKSNFNSMAENSILCLHGPMSTFNCLFNGPNPTSTQWQRTQFSAYMVPCQPSTASSMAQIQLQLNGRELNSLPTWSHVNLQLPLQWPKSNFNSMAENSILCLHGPMSTFNCLFNGPNPTSTQWQRTQFSAYMVPCQPSTASSMAQIQLQLNGREPNSLVHGRNPITCLHSPISTSQLSSFQNPQIFRTISSGHPHSSFISCLEFIMTMVLSYPLRARIKLPNNCAPEQRAE